ncbi:NAD(P)/FAD-dependent oxidoreductase [Dendrosporobacter sp. 1207_IL3150]|uniref:NAD(P)/FAD-dependent oxidoreductase n=1 Tax=Dendrosporobacter sp. 1207_IL3150 TaxID=3084054 RepID=UPI002FDA2092
METRNETKRDMLDKGAVLQRDKETYAIAPHIPGGIVLDFNVMRKIVDTAEKYGAQALKITSSQRIAIVGLKEEDVDKVWDELGMQKGHAIGLCVRSIKICPATHFCKRAQQDAVTLGLELDGKYHGMDLPSKFKISVAGCMNSCSEPAVRDLGIMGTPKGYTIMIGGNAGIKPRLGDILLENVPQEDVIPVVDKIVNYYKDNARKYERIGLMIDRIGLDKVKSDILG